MNYLKAFCLYGAIYTDWWPYKVVAWYCEKRGIGRPKGRCYFGEILLFYAPAYLILGLLFKLVLYPLLRVTRLIFAPIWLPILWFARRVAEDEKDHATEKRPAVILALSLFAGLVVMVPFAVISELKDPGLLFTVIGVSSTFGSMAIFFAGSYLVIWTVPVMRRRIGPVIAFGQEAAQRITFSRLAWQAVSTVARAPFKGAAIGGRHSGTTMRTLWTIARNTWRQKICTPVYYVSRTPRSINFPNDTR